jgi:hypothetical protein
MTGFIFTVDPCGCRYRRVLVNTAEGTEVTWVQIVGCDAHPAPSAA